MRRTDIEAVGDVAGEALAAGGGLVKSLHEGIAGRPFGVLGAAAAPVRVVHDGVARAVYGGVRGALRTAAHAGAAVAARGAEDAGPALAAGPRSSIALAALNGLYGDHLDARGNGLALGMGFRHHGEDVDPTPAGLAAAFPDATSRVAVFVHGLGETDEAWRLLPLRGAGRARRRTYGERLQDELELHAAAPPLQHRPAHLATTAASSRRLLDDARRGLAGRRRGARPRRPLDGRPRGPQRLPLRRVDDRRWTAAVRHVFCLGTPHLGADLEKGVNVLGWALGRLPGDQAARATCSTPAASASRTCASARASRRTGAAARTPTSSCATAARRSRSSRRPLLLRRRDADARGRSGACSATCSSACRARRGAARTRPLDPVRGRQRARARPA